MLRRVPNVIVALPVKRAHALKTHWAFWPKWIEKSRSRVPLPLPVKRAHALKTHCAVIEDRPKLKHIV